VRGKKKGERGEITTSEEFFLNKTDFEGNEPPKLMQTKKILENI